MKYHIYVAHTCNYNVNLQFADRTEIFLFVNFKSIITLVISKLYELPNSKTHYINRCPDFNTGVLQKIKNT